jgi:beta-lactamase class A
MGADQEYLKVESSKALLDLMHKCERDNRLKGMLPLGTPLAHKTGSLMRKTITDVGIITLPQDLGHLAMAVFVKAPGAPDVECEVAIAQIARSLYDFQLYAK